MTTTAQITAIAHASTFVAPEKSASRVSYAENGGQPYIRTADVARITLDGRFALLRPHSRNSYVLAVRIDDEDEVQRLAGKSYSEGYGRSELPLYRALPFHRSSRNASRYSTGIKLADIIAEAAQITPRLAVLEDPFKLELDASLEADVDRLVQLIVASAETRTTGARRISYIDGWNSSLSTEQRELYNRLRKALKEAADEVHPFGGYIVQNTALGRARAEIGEELRYDEQGLELAFTGERPDPAAVVEAAHAEAVEYVLELRRNRAEGVAKLEARIPELEAELVEVLQNRVELAERQLQRHRELALLATRDVYEAAAQAVEGISSLGYHSRSADVVARELGDTVRELEQAQAWAEPNTVLVSDTLAHA